MEKTKTRWVFSPQPSLVWTVLCVTRLKPEAQTGLERLRRRGCAARLARDVRATSPTDDHHSHARAMARAEGQSYPGGREGKGGGGGWGSCDGKLSNQTCTEEEKRKGLWQNILKALLGDDWLIAPSPRPPSPTQTAGTLHSLI